MNTKYTNTKHLFKIYRYCFLSAFFLSVLHLFIVKGRDMVTFTIEPANRLFAFAIIGLTVVFCYLFYFIFSLCMWKLWKKDPLFLGYLKYFLIYFIFMGLFWLLTWPGIFKGDEFYVIKAARSFTLSGAQSGLTSIFYIISLLFFPSMATIVFLQLLIICSIFAVMMHDLLSLFERKTKYLLFVPFALLPVIDANLFTLRSTLVGWIFLFVLCKTYYLTKTNTFSTKYLLLLSLLSGLLAAWRSEYIYLLLLLPLFYLFTGQLKIRKAIIMVLLIGLCFTVCNIPNKIALNGSNKYPISLVLNPLANLFTEAETLKGPCVYDDIMTINELVDVPLLRQSASVRNISQYWNIEDVLPEETLNRFMKAALRLIVYNPDKFLKYRLQTFAYTNSFYPGYVNHPGGECPDAINQLVYYDMDYKAMFVMMNPPFGQKLREKTISLLALRTYEAGNIQTSPLLPIFYNCVPVLIGMLALFFAGILKKNKVVTLLSILVSIQVVLIFLTAPAMFFMYYFCFYLSGYMMIMLGINELLHRK